MSKIVHEFVNTVYELKVDDNSEPCYKFNMVIIII